MSVTLETVLELLDKDQPFRRCLAATAIAPRALKGMVSSASLARNMRRVGKCLHPTLMARARQDNPPLRALIHVAWGKGLEEQSRRWSAVVVAQPANDVAITRHDPSTPLAA